MADAAQPWVIVRGPSTGFAQAIEIGKHQLTGDEPLGLGGTDTGPDPYGFLLAALGSCTSMTLSLYARKREWPLESVAVRLRHSKVHAQDCTDCEHKPAKLDRIEREIELVGSLSEEQRSTLLAIADRCPVHRTLMSEIRIDSRLI